MKKLIAIILTVAMCLSLVVMPVEVSAEGDAKLVMTITPDPVNIDADTEVTIVVRLENESPNGISGGTFSVQLPDWAEFEMTTDSRGNRVPSAGVIEYGLQLNDPDPNYASTIVCNVTENNVLKVVFAATYPILPPSDPNAFLFKATFKIQPEKCDPIKGNNSFYFDSATEMAGDVSAGESEIKFVVPEPEEEGGGLVEFTCNNHTYGEPVVTPGANPCTDPGVETKTCTKCGHVETTTQGTAPGHKGDGKFVVSTVDPTKHVEHCTVCEEEINAADHTNGDVKQGNHTHYYECTVCGRKTEEVPCEDKDNDNNCDTCGQAMHEHEKGTTMEHDDKSHWYPCVAVEGCKYRFNEEEHKLEDSDVKDSTCSEEGSKTVKCTVEGCGYTDAVTIPKKDHVPAKDRVGVKDATCEEKGYTGDIVCENCKTVITKGEETPALGHDWGEWKETKAPTCTEKGTEERECKRCGKKETRDKDALGHKYDEGKVTKEPTCEEDGVKTFTCQNDNTHTYTEAIPATGHKFENAKDNGDGTHSGTCSVCGKTETGAPHTNERKSDGTNHWDECTVCGAKSNVEAHKSTGTVVDKSGHHDVCAVCGEVFNETTHSCVVVEAKPATESANGVAKHWVCTVCGKFFDDVNGVPGGEMFDNEDMWVIPFDPGCSLGHAVVYTPIDENNHYGHCLRDCGYTITAKHSFDMYGVCRICKYQRVEKEEEKVEVEVPVEAKIDATVTETVR